MLLGVAGWHSLQATKSWLGGWIGCLLNPYFNGKKCKLMHQLELRSSL
jgi:hypothetical protein